MECILLKLDELPLVRNIDYRVANKHFIHPNRVLSYNVLIYILEGQMKIWENDIEYILNQGELLFLKSGLHHWGVDKIETNTKWYYIHFYQSDDLNSYTSYDQYATYIKKQEFEPIDYQHFIILPKKIHLKNSNSIEKNLQKLLMLYHSSNNLRAVYLSTALMEFFLDIYDISKEQSTRNKSEIITQKLISFLENNLSHSISSDIVSEHMHMNYKYLCSIFKAQTGMSILDYHTRIRINEAARLLRETQMNVSEVGYNVGYMDSFYFSNVFKKIKGQSPTDYLKQSSPII